ncbi:hypothetical protein SPHINGOR109_50025 [Sphingorhabdus sp. 109]|nr:hypothetical protein SPHINGOR109_50025 [Sphingorhabdus sp. 109]
MPRNRWNWPSCSPKCSIRNCPTGHGKRPDHGRKDEARADASRRLCTWRIAHEQGSHICPQGNRQQGCGVRQRAGDCHQLHHAQVYPVGDYSRLFLLVLCDLLRVDPVDPKTEANVRDFSGPADYQFTLNELSGACDDAITPMDVGERTGGFRLCRANTNPGPDASGDCGICAEEIHHVFDRCRRA